MELQPEGKVRTCESNSSGQTPRSVGQGTPGAGVDPPTASGTDHGDLIGKKLKLN